MMAFGGRWIEVKILTLSSLLMILLDSHCPIQNKSAAIIDNMATIDKRWEGKKGVEMLRERERGSTGRLAF
jgi:hypothetical protein